MTEVIRVLQADGDRDYRQAVADYFGRLDDFLYLGGLDSGEDLVNTIAEQKPHVVFLDLDLPPQGGFPLLQEIRGHWCKQDLAVILFAVTDHGEAYLGQAADLGADYFILRPVDLVVLEKRARQVLTANPMLLEHHGPTLKQVQEICVRYFEAMGVPPHYKGYRYLIEGIWLVRLYPSWLGSMTKKLYPAIGQRFGTTGSQVERAMRYTLDVTWEKGDLEELYRFFPYEVRENKGKPTNSAFIAKMADLVGMELG